MRYAILSRAAEFFNSRPKKDKIAALYLAIINDVADTLPPTRYEGNTKLGGEDLKEVFYLHLRRYGRSDRMYFYCDKGILCVIHLITDKRRTKLTHGELDQLHNALQEAKAYIADAK